MQNLNNFYIYSYSDHSNIFYVGRGAGLRMYDHLKIANKNNHSNRLFQDRIDYLNEHNEIPIIEKIKENLSSEEADLLEKELIKKYGRMGYEENGILVNRTLGGEHGLAGLKHSASTKLKMSEKAKLRTGEKNPRAKKWKVINPQGKEFITNDLVGFCKTFDIYYRGFTRCFRGSDGILKSGKNKGWILGIFK
jgi:hypothetical protein